MGRSGIRFRYIPVVFLLGAVVFGEACGEKPRPKVIISSYGRYEVADAGRITLEDASGSCAILSTGHRLIETTKRIPCRIGENWGFGFELQNLPKHREVNYRSEMHHPAIRQPDGSMLTNTIVRRAIRPGMAAPNSELWGFCKGYEYELVPGEWTRKIFIDDVEVASMTFELAEETSSSDITPINADYYWQWATNRHNAQAYRCFIYHYPDDPRIPQARVWWEELDFEWTLEKDAGWAYRRFLRNHPNSRFVLKIPEQYGRQDHTILTTSTFPASQIKDNLLAKQSVNVFISFLKNSALLGSVYLRVVKSDWLPFP